MVVPKTQAAVYNPKKRLEPGARLTVEPETLSSKLEKRVLILKSPEKIAKAKEIIARAKEIEKKLKSKTGYSAKKELASARAKIKQYAVDENAMKVISFVEKHCSQSMDIFKQSKHVMFRGMGNEKRDVIIGSPWTNRRPKDSSVEDQNMLDSYLEAAGFTALRRNSTFVSSNLSQAENYGSVYVIFPKNGFSYTWSSIHDDLIITPDLFDNGTFNWKEARDDFMYYEGYDLIEMIENPSGVLDKDFTTKELKILKQFFEPMFVALKKMKGSKSDKEVASAIVEYINLASQYVKNTTIPATLRKAINAEIKSITKQKLYKDSLLVANDKFNEMTPQKVKSFIEENEFKNTDIVSALRAGGEICVSGEYIALSLDKYKYVLSHYLGFNLVDEWDDEDY